MKSNKIEVFLKSSYLYLFFSLSLNEKIDLQEVEINEQTIVIDELRNEIHQLNEQPQMVPSATPIITTTSNNEQKYLIEKLDKKLYELETERTNLVFEHERLKTNFDLCIDEKQHLIQQKNQINNEFKKLKLRVLALQDQIYKLKRNNHPKDLIPIVSIKRRIIKKKPKKSCLELLLDQNSTLIDDLQNESLISNRQTHRSYGIYEHQNNNSFIRRRRRPSMSSTISKTGCLCSNLFFLNKKNSFFSR